MVRPWSYICATILSMQLLICVHSKLIILQIMQIHFLICFTCGQSWDISIDYLYAVLSTELHSKMPRRCLSEIMRIQQENVWKQISEDEEAVPLVIMQTPMLMSYKQKHKIYILCPASCRFYPGTTSCSRHFPVVANVFLWKPNFLYIFLSSCLETLLHVSFLPSFLLNLTRCSCARRRAS